MPMLDASTLDDWQKDELLDGFLPLLHREILDNVADELEQADRQEFDDCVIQILGLPVEREQVYDCLRRLVEIRLAAKN